jgi:hypothetical protein
MPRKNVEDTHWLRNGVIASLIAAAIWSLIPGWPWTFRAISTIARPLAWHAPLWLVALILIVAGVTLKLFRRGIVTVTTSEPDFTDYIEDSFFGAVWRWHYYAFAPSQVHAFCPTCDMQLVYHEDRGAFHAAGMVQTHFICERCKAPVATIDGYLDDVNARIVREIQRKIRTGEYKRLLISAP